MRRASLTTVFGVLSAAAAGALTIAWAEPVAVEIVDPDTGAAMMGDPGKDGGEKVFKQCLTCHTLEPGKNKVGPTLYGIIGRTAGSVEGYNYSKANKESGKVWTEQAMFDYLANPKDPEKGIPGTKMAFVGLKKKEDRANVIAYIQESYKAAEAAKGGAAPAETPPPAPAPATP